MMKFSVLTAAGLIIAICWALSQVLLPLYHMVSLHSVPYILFCQMLEAIMVIMKKNKKIQKKIDTLYIVL